RARFRFWPWAMLDFTSSVHIVSPGQPPSPWESWQGWRRPAMTGRWGGAGATAIPSPTNRCTLLGAPAGAVLLLLLLLVGLKGPVLLVLLPLPLVLAEHPRLSSELRVLDRPPCPLRFLHALGLVLRIPLGHASFTSLRLTPQASVCAAPGAHRPAREGHMSLAGEGNRRFAGRSAFATIRKKRMTSEGGGRSEELSDLWGRHRCGYPGPGFGPVLRMRGAHLGAGRGSAGNPGAGRQ